MTRFRRAIAAFAIRDLQIGLSYKIPFVLEILGSVFALLTVWFVARLIGPGIVPGGYFPFVVAGLVVSSFVDAGIEALGGSIRNEQLTGTLEATLASGLPASALAGGMSAYPMISAVFGAVVYGVLAALLGARAPGANWSLALVAIVLGSVAFAGLGLMGAAIVLVVRRASAAVGWLVAALALGAGEFFPPGLLPGWVRGLARLSPFTWCLEVVRNAVLKGGSWSQGWDALAVLAGMAVAFTLLGLAALVLGLRHARRRGTLGQY
ncbi:MAG: ABC transporter permease [Actinomycetota bacterium]|nr:ABC transporter permease [Actinomycetota bacterium]